MTNATLDISEARKQFNQIDKLVDVKGFITITRHRKEAFAVVDIDFLTTILETIEIMKDPESHHMFMQSMEDIKNGRLIDHEDVEREFGV